MGYYINPKNATKEEWLRENSTKISREPLPHDAENNLWPVCLVSNGAFTAAGICYSEREFLRFSTNDGRPKIWCLVHKDKLSEFITTTQLKW